MLSFEEKIELIETHFPQLTRKNISLGRVNYHLEESKRDKKIVVQQLHPNGNGFVYAGHLDRRQKNDKELVNIRDYSSEDLISLISNSIDYLSSEKPVAATEPEIPVKETWTGGADNERLLLVHEDELWNIYAGLNLEAAFESYIEAHDYLVEEGFEKVSSTSR
ncbi:MULTISPECIES: hypothetical protein [Fictibacillus]|uniref:Uncharacterized protein n=1 Tax=Fictibacillus enclensis TaxID=1017270 RepID=A0A0V8JBH6_9BACL|nr:MULTISPECIES: hypothetical protein [Fictibacillus]KSU84329.1 hypothetical protein AS030_01850 [Fictibacillus enclensis]RXZ00047.1 hypothetical protein DMO16_10310 [Fictibacillus sp. S7]SCB77301.1 hypothetical protein GA0061096_0398 [Fictibacillus enclensis]